MIIYIDVDLVSTVVDSQRKPVPLGGGILRISNTGYSKFRITLKTTYKKYWEYREWDFSYPHHTKLNYKHISGVFARFLETFKCLWIGLYLFVLLSPSGDLGIGLVWDDHPLPNHFLVRLLKSSSNWTKLSMMGPQLISVCFPMFWAVFWCCQPGCNFYA